MAKAGHELIVFCFLAWCLTIRPNWLLTARRNCSQWVNSPLERGIVDPKRAVFKIHLCCTCMCTYNFPLFFCSWYLATFKYKLSIYTGWFCPKTASNFWGDCWRNCMGIYSDVIFIVLEKVLHIVTVHCVVM